MSDLITPTIGRRVWFRPHPDLGRLLNSGPFICLNDQVPMDAGIVYVWHDRMVNLDVTDHAGNHHAITSVELWQGDNDRPNFSYAEWMPFQKGQAKKDAAPTVEPAGRLLSDGTFVETAPAPITIAQAFARLKAAIADDPDYAWAWHCNLAMPIKDELDVSHEQANQAAARLMRHTFDFDSAEHPYFKDFAKEWAHVRTASGIVIPPAGSTNPATAATTGFPVTLEAFNDAWKRAQAKLGQDELDRKAKLDGAMEKLGASRVSFGSKLANDVTVEDIKTAGCGCSYCRGCAEVARDPEGFGTIAIDIPKEWALEPMTTSARAAEAVDAFLAETSGEALKAYLEPRTVTMEDIHAAIVSEHYFTAADGVIGADRETMDLHGATAGPLGLLTFCVLVLRNGYTVTGQSACADPAIFNSVKGRKYALDDAKEKVWPLLGYVLKDQLHHESLAAEADRALRITKLGDNA